MDIISVMTHALQYCEDSPQPRRCFWLFVLLGPIFLGACAAPANQPPKVGDEHRAAIQGQNKAALANADQLLDQGKLDEAALALFRAEFIVRTQANLFSKSECADFKRQVAQRHSRLEFLYSPTLKDREKSIAELKRKRELEKLEPSNVIIDYNDLEMENKARMRTIIALESRAGSELRAGNYDQAKGTCLRILFLDPVHRFEDPFWTNVPK